MKSRLLLHLGPLPGGGRPGSGSDGCRNKALASRSSVSRCDGVSRGTLHRPRAAWEPGTTPQSSQSSTATKSENQMFRDLPGYC